MGWVLSKELGVRTPDGSVVVSEGCASGWASQAIKNVLGWDPDEADLCDQDDVAGLFVLDALGRLRRREEIEAVVLDESLDCPRLQVLEVRGSGLGGSRLGESAPDRDLSCILAESTQSPESLRAHIAVATRGKFDKNICGARCVRVPKRLTKSAMHIERQ